MSALSTIPETDAEKTRPVAPLAKALGVAALAALLVAGAARLSIPWLAWTAFFLGCAAFAVASRRPLMGLTELTLFLLVASPHDVELFDRFGLNLILGGLKVYFSEILIAFLVLATALAALAGGDPSRRIAGGLFGSPFGALLLLWTGAVAFTLLLGVERWGWKTPFSDARFLLGYGIFLPLCLHLGDAAALRRLIRVFLWALICHAAVLAVLWLGRDSYAAWLPRELRAYDPYAQHGLRIFFQTTSAMPLALLPAMAVWAASRAPFIRSRAVIVIAAAGFSLLLASTRSLLAPVAASVLALIAALLLHPRAPRGLGLKTLGGAAALAVLFAAAVAFSPSFRRVAETTAARVVEAARPEGRGPLQNRLETAAHYFDRFREAPWLGHGFGARMAFHFQGMVIDHGYTIDFAYLVIAYKGGLAALLPFLALTLLPPVQLLGIAYRRRSRPDSLIALALALALFSLLFAAGCMTSQLLVSNPVIASFVGSAVLAERWRREPDLLASYMDAPGHVDSGP